MPKVFLSEKNKYIKVTIILIKNIINWKLISNILNKKRSTKKKKKHSMFYNERTGIALSTQLDLISSDKSFKNLIWVT